MTKKILVIDDEAILTKTFSRLLQKKSYCVTTAGSGEEAIALFNKDKFDLVISDIRMPGKDGVKTAFQIQQMQQEKGESLTPFIFLTGFADKDLELRAQALNPLAYIYKPFDALHLLDVIANYFNKNKEGSS